MRIEKLSIGDQVRLDNSDEFMTVDYVKYQNGEVSFVWCSNNFILDSRIAEVKVKND